MPLARKSASSRKLTKNFFCKQIPQRTFRGNSRKEKVCGNNFILLCTMVVKFIDFCIFGARIANTYEGKQCAEPL